MKPIFSWIPSDKVILEVVIRQNPYHAVVQFEEFLFAIEDLGKSFYPRVKPEENIKQGKERFYEVLSLVKDLWQRKYKV
jgi:hypothetical protein